jgi:hypothetical protein
MKVLMIAVSLAVLATTGAAYAANSAANSAAGSGSTSVEKSNVARTDQWSPGNAALPRTRAQVRQELVQAQKSGELALLNNTLYRSGS